jgi:glycosyltransferase involved in cell wall biosynthesis
MEEFMLVTIGIPFYNDESTLLNSIRSVFAQTYKDWELILVDDGSSDDSLKIAQSISDSKVKVISDGENKGLPNRLNQITKLARGKYIARMDADDLMHPDRIKAQIEFLESNPQLDVVGCNAYIVDENNVISGLRSSSINLKPESILSNGLFIHPTVCGKKSWFAKNPYSKEFVRAEDHELWVRTLYDSNFSKVSDALFFYRVNKKIKLRNHLLSYRTDRKIIRKYGPGIVGQSKTYKLILKLYLKSFICRISVLFQADHVVIQRNTETLNRNEMDEAESFLDSIVNTPIPGINDNQQLLRSDY